MLLQNEIYVQNNGLISGSMGFKSLQLIVYKPLICFGSSNNCVRPTKYDIVEPQSGSTDDPDSGHSPSYFNRVYSFWYYISKKIFYMITIIAIWILNTIIVALLCFVFFKVISRTLLALIIYACCTNGSNAMLGNKEYLNDYINKTAISFQQMTPVYMNVVVLTSQPNF